MLLAHFGAGDDLLVNTQSSSVDKIFEILSKEIAERRINYPLVFGRALHDEFIENFGATPIEQLTPEQTQRLIALTPQGVFQVEEWVSGPLGLLRSAQRRYLRPQSCGPVIRCRQVGCNELHHILMRTSETDLAPAYTYLATEYPVSVDLQQKLVNILLPDDDYYRVNHPGALPWLIGNGFTDDELSRLFEDMLARNVGGLRERVNTLLGGSTPKKAPTVIVNALNYAELIQALLLLDDVSLVDSIESAIDERLIELSSTEVRRSFENRHLNGGRFKVDAEASRLGVRFIPQRNVTEPRMLAVIRAAFDGYETALSWQLRNEPGADSLSKLERCLEEQDPRKLLRMILFSSQESLERTFSVLKYGRFRLPSSNNADEALVEKIMWKLGSPLPTPMPAQATLERLTVQMLNTIAVDYPDDESRITAIRNVGINMFVELEDLLRACSNFACWALLNDHYDLHPFDRFRYYESHARAFAAKLFGDEAAKRGDAFPYDPTTGNVLSVLINSFRVLADICGSRLRDRKEYIRPSWQIPAFSNHSDVQQFPLQHTTLFLDLRPESQQRLIDCLRSVALALTRTDVCERRNSLGHPREFFPSNEKLAESVQAIRTAIGFLSSEGLIPTIRQYAGEDIDKFNRRRIRMADGRGDDVRLTAPNQLMMIDLPSYLSPQIIVQDALFAGTLQPARFEVANDSAWAEKWHDVGRIDSWLNRRDSSIVPDGIAPDGAGVVESSVPDAESARKAASA